jgi:hypothetical protein
MMDEALYQPARMDEEDRPRGRAERLDDIAFIKIFSTGRILTSFRSPTWMKTVRSAAWLR